MSCKLPVASCQLPVASCQLPVASCQNCKFSQRVCEGEFVSHFKFQGVIVRLDKKLIDSNFV